MSEPLADLYALRSSVDELIERGLVSHWTVGEMLEALLPQIAERTGAQAVFIETYGEDLELHVFRYPAGAPLDVPEIDEVQRRTSEIARERVDVVADGRRVVAQHLDVAGEWFGRAGLVAPESSDGARLASMLDAFCEVLDNYLYSLKAMRQKHEVMMRLGTALRHRVLAEGLRQAVAVLADAMPIERLLLVYVAEENAAKSLHVQLFEGKALKVDTLASHGETYAGIRLMGQQYLRGDGNALLEEMGVTGAQEEVLINGITKSVVVGKVVATSKSGAFNTWDRELLSAFAGFIRQRVVDFNKEWRALATSFRPDDVARLVSGDDYEQKFLAPREETVGILYVDISGFTRLSEQVLKTPAKVAELVEEWSKDAVDLVWQHGGVFDKMVGDCVIALFGPPFYDQTPGERLAAALRCAKDIRLMTNKLPERMHLSVLKPHGVSVSTGVHLAPLFVGRFGPNGNFTGFSSGMNNTARLQGCAAKDEILVMEEALAALPPETASELRFGEPRSMPVKNVAEPLRFRPLL